ncbi:MAG TPA: pitrilysin family protein, partial [Caldilineaceae bacterium]|nr:pitrilysin family protein [Caldilineaceae bacterium]
MHLSNAAPLSALSLRLWKQMLVLLLVVTALLPGGPARAAAPAQPAPPEEAAPLDISRYRLPIEDYTLRNGLRVILAQDDSAPVVAVNVTYWVGAAHDPVGRSGFAHLFEHMMFHGSANVPDRQFGAYLAKIGADPTSFNAYTDFDRTAYYATVPANQLPLMLWLESDRMASLVVNQESFDTERHVVIEELNQRLYNSAYGVPYRRSYALPFLGYPPYDRFVIGSKEDLEAATLDEVIAFHARYYVPNNATLTIVGDIDLPVTKALVEAYFGDIPAGDSLTPILAQYPMPAEFPVLRTDEATGCHIGYEEVMIDPLAEQPLAIGMIVGPKPADPDFPAAALLATILGTGDSSRLERNLVQTGLVPFVYAWIDPATLGAFTFQFEIYVEQPEDLDPALTLTRGEMYKIVSDGVTEAELARAKNQLIVDIVNDYYATVGNTAEQLQFYTFSFGTPDFLQSDIERLQAVTVEEVQAAAKKYLCDRPLSVISVFKEGQAVPVTHPGVAVQQVVEIDPLAGLPEGIVSRTQAPAALPAGAVEVPPFTTFTLENGLTVALVQQDKAPVVR